MAVYTDKVVLELEAKLANYHRDLLQGQRRFDKAMESMEKGLKKVESQSVLSFAKLTTALSAVGGALGTMQIVRYADAWTDLSSRVGLAVGVMDKAPQVMERLYDMAQRTYTEFNTTAEGFLGFSTALKEMGLSTNESLNFVESFNNAMVVSGAKAERAASLQFALSKALGAGVLKGEEFNRVMEIGGRFTELLAEHFGVTTGELRKIASDGKITGAVINEVLTKNFQRLREEAESMPATITDGFMRIQNAVWKYIGTMDQASGVTGVLASLLVTLSDNFDLVANTGLIATGILLSRYVPALARTAVAQASVLATNPFLALAAAISLAAGYLVTYSDQLKVAEGDLANLGDYGAVALEGLRDAGVQAGEKISEAFNDMTSWIIQALDGVGLEWEDVTGFILGSVNKLIGAIRAAHGVAATVFTSLPGVVADAAISAMQLMVDVISAALGKVVEGINKVIRGLKSIPGLGSQIGDEFEWGGLGEIPNAYKGAMSGLAEDISGVLEEAFSRDYVGEGAAAADGFFSGWQSKANERAAIRGIGQVNDLLFGTGENSLDNDGSGGGGGGGGSGSGGKGKKGKKGKAGYNILDDLKDLKLRTEALIAETEALSKLDPLAEDYELQLTRLKTEQELLNKAQKEGVELSPAVRGAISSMALAYAEADEAAKKLRESQDLVRKQYEDWMNAQKDATKGFIKDLASGKDAMEALGNAVGKLADKLLDLALDNLFSGFGGGGGGWLSGLLGFLGGRRAGGGPTKKGVPYLVNENTPNSEVFVPSQSGGVLNVPQAQDALVRAAKASSQFGSAAQVAGAGGASSYKSETSITISLAGANGDQAIEDAVNRGIRKAAPVIQSAAVRESSKVVGNLSRKGTKSYLGI